jgi:hypothetical protein
MRVAAFDVPVKVVSKPCRAPRPSCQVIVSVALCPLCFDHHRLANGLVLSHGSYKRLSDIYGIHQEQLK